MLLPPPDRLKYALPPRCGMGFGAVDGDADMAAVVAARWMDALSGAPAVASPPAADKGTACNPRASATTRASDFMASISPSGPVGVTPAHSGLDAS